MLLCFSVIIMSVSIGWLPAKSKVNSSSYTWQIKNFNHTKFHTKSHDYYQRNEIHINGIQSSTFTFSFMRNETNENRNCSLWLTRDPFERNESSSEQLSPWLRLSLTTSSIPLLERLVVEDDFRNICIAWICGSKKRRMSTCKLTGGFYHATRIGGVKEFSVSNPHFVLYDDLLDREKGLLCGDMLTVVCEVRAFTNDVRHVDSWLFHPLESEVSHDTQRTLANDLRQILGTGYASDVTLVAKCGKKFPAHVLILSSRSPVFAAMFQHDMKEKREKCVTINDLSSQVVEGLLEFMYTDSVTAIITLAPELLAAAHKYDISRLKTYCGEAMTSELKIENAAEYLYLADLYGADQLRTEAKQFTLTNLYKVKKTAGWKKLHSQSPHVTDELMDELAELMRQLTST